MTDSDKYADEIPDKKLIERLLAGRPDAEQLRAILSRSYAYIRKLPLKGLIENYSIANAGMSEVVS
jgi:hypothetical protein